MSTQAIRFFIYLVIITGIRTLIILPKSVFRQSPQESHSEKNFIYTIESNLNVTEEMQQPKPILRFQREFGENRLKIFQYRSYRDCININTASRDRLMVLPEVGERIALQIIHHRETNGPIRSLDELRQITAMNEYTFSRLEPLVCVD